MVTTTRARIGSAGLFALIAACSSPGEAERGDASVDASASRAVVLPPTIVAAPSSTIAIAAGRSLIGSRPASPYRDTRLEAPLAWVEHPAFEIDRLPYPNDPLRPPLTNVSLAEAERLCAEAGKRVCSEVEWERACHGTAGHTFPTGEALDVEACALDHTSCASDEGVVLGHSLAEWTRAPRPEATTTMVRGASAIDPVAAHRCASRRPTRVEATSAIGFRCCRSASTPPAYPEATRRGPAWSSRPADTTALREVFRGIPELAQFADTFAPSSTDEIDRALSRGHRSRENLSGWQAIDGVGVWRPFDGEEAWIVVGSVGDRHLLAAIFPTASDSYVHAASLLVEEGSPIAVGFNEQTPHELLFSTCWGCGGEGGVIRRKDNGTYAIEPR